MPFHFHTCSGGVQLLIIAIRGKKKAGKKKDDLQSTITPRVLGVRRRKKDENEAREPKFTMITVTAPTLYEEWVQIKPNQYDTYLHFQKPTR